jgi:hypothetical protein
MHIAVPESLARSWRALPVHSAITALCDPDAALRTDGRLQRPRDGHPASAHCQKVSLMVDPAATLPQDVPRAGRAASTVLPIAAAPYLRKLGDLLAWTGGGSSATRCERFVKGRTGRA